MTRPPAPSGYGAPPPPAPYGGYTAHSPLPQISEPAPTTTLGPSMARGVLCGLLAGLAGGTLWFAIVAGTNRQFYYVAVLLGLAIGYAVSWGAGRGGVATGAISAVIALASVVASYFYIIRYLAIVQGEDQGLIFDIPLLPGFDVAKTVLRIGFEAEPTNYLMCVLCVGGAAVFGFKGIEQSRRFGRR